MSIVICFVFSLVIFCKSFLFLGRLQSFTVSKIECFKQGVVLNALEWNNKIGLWCYFVGLHIKVMINRISRGYSYANVRGEILGFFTDEQLRKHLSRMFSLIKNES